MKKLKRLESSWNKVMKLSNDSVHVGDRGDSCNELCVNL